MAEAFQEKVFRKFAILIKKYYLCTAFSKTPKKVIV